MAKLLAVVSVDKSQRVRCRAPGCKCTVYAQIYVVETDEGKIQVLGSACYKNLYHKDESINKKPFYTGTSSRQLTEEERNLLDQNTEALIQKFEIELKQQKDFIQTGIDVQVSPHAHSNIPKSRKSRSVKCHFCGAIMETFLVRAPAIGYKCQRCKDKGVTTSLAARKRLARFRRF